MVLFIVTACDAVALITVITVPACPTASVSGAFGIFFGLFYVVHPCCSCYRASIYCCFILSCYRDCFCHFFVSRFWSRLSLAVSILTVRFIGPFCHLGPVTLAGGPTVTAVVVVTATPLIITTLRAANRENLVRRVSFAGALDANTTDKASQMDRRRGHWRAEELLGPERWRER